MQPETTTEPELLITSKEISGYLGICDGTLYNWRKNHGFPACPLPDGRIAVSKSLINQWLLARHDLKGTRNHGKGRNWNVDTKNQQDTPDSSSK